jgi:hypothetical protein
VGMRGKGVGRGEERKGRGEVRRGKEIRIER